MFKALMYLLIILGLIVAIIWIVQIVNDAIIGYKTSDWSQLKHNFSGIKNLFTAFTNMLPSSVKPANNTNNSLNVTN